MDDTTAQDLNRLFDAIRTVRQAAVVESAAVGDMLAAPSDVAIKAVHAAHLAELDAVQAMGAAMELLRRRQPAFMKSIAENVASRPAALPSRRASSVSD